MVTTTTNKREPGKPRARIQVLVEQVRKKLKNYTVRDKRSRLVGKVKDVNLDTHDQLNLVICQPETLKTDTGVLVLGSQHIQKIDVPSHSLFVDVNEREIEHIPEQTLSETFSCSNPVQELEDVPLTHTREISTSTNVKAELEPQIVTEVEPELPQPNVLGEAPAMPKVMAQAASVVPEQLSNHAQPAGDQSQVNLSSTNSATVSGEFVSAKTASLLLDAIALERHPGYEKVRVEVTLSDPELQATYQEWFDRCSQES